VNEPRSTSTLRVSHVWRGEVMGDRVLPRPATRVPGRAQYALAASGIAIGLAIVALGFTGAVDVSDARGAEKVFWNLLPVAGVVSLVFGSYHLQQIARARRRLEAGTEVTVGDSRGATFNTPAFDLPPGFAMFRRGARGYVLTLGQRMKGTVRIGGEEMPVQQLLARTGGGAGQFRATPIAPGDWGVIDLDGNGEHEIFFQFVPEEDPLPAGVGRDFWDLMAPALVFSAVLHGVFLTYAFLEGRPERNAFVFPGSDAIMNDYLINRPPDTPDTIETKFELDEPKAGTEDGEKDAPPASTVGESGKSGGRGDKPRRRAPDPHQGSAEDPVVEKVRQTGLLRHRGTFDKVANRGGFDKRLGNAMARIQGPANDGGRGGHGRGEGTGVGDAIGTGTTRGGNGKGPGGGGTAHGDVVTQGEIKTGGKRPARGSPRGRGVKEVAVHVKTGNASGDFNGLTKGQVQKVVLSRKNAIRACYERQLQRNPRLGGKIIIRWTISPAGSVSGAPRVKSTTMRDGAVEDCIGRQIGRLRFPRAKNGAATIVNFPFIFEQR